MTKVPKNGVNFYLRGMHLLKRKMINHAATAHNICPAGIAAKPDNTELLISSFKTTTNIENNNHRNVGRIRQ